MYSYVAHFVGIKTKHNISAPWCPFQFCVYFLETDSPITHLMLFEKWLEIKHFDKKTCRDGLVTYVLEQRNECQRDLIVNFVKNIEKRWKICRRDQTKFIKKYKTWLDSPFKIPEQDHDPQAPMSSKVGRPSKKFQECGTRAKQKKVQNLMSLAKTDELLFDTQVSLRKDEKRDAAKIVEEIANPISPKKVKKYKDVYHSLEDSKQTVVPMTSEDALSLLINTKSSKSTYLAYRESAINCNANIYPSWNKILSAKRDCLPDPNKITIQDTEVEIKLQDLLNLTADRICKLQANVLTSVSSTRLVLLCKWGIDGSSGQSNYRQVTSADKTDSSVIIICLVPLQLRDFEDETKILWENPVPSSTRFCRAIKFIFSKETPEITVDETRKINEQINDLRDFSYEDKMICFRLILTMVDGKVCHTLTDTKSTQSCYICHAKPKEMNDLKNITTKLANIENYSFGLSTLHS